jgi:archaellin
VGGEMNNKGSVGITAIPLFSSVFLIGATVSTVMFEGTDDMTNDAEKILNDVIDEITTYLKIDDIIGKYYNTNGNRRVEKIVILVKQLFQNAINMSEMTIKISNNNDIILLGYSGHAVESNSEALFEDQVWGETNNAFSLIVTQDNDRSLLDYNIMNKDTAFIAIKLPEQLAMKNDESIIISLIPAKGIIRSIVFETPSFHSSNILSFREN